MYSLRERGGTGRARGEARSWARAAPAGPARGDRTRARETEQIQYIYRV